jgi:hypothetical protein
MPPTAAARLTWPDVMAGFTGLRLAIHDELLRKGALEADSLAQALAADPAGARLRDVQAQLEQAVDWLHHHRLLAPSADGTWRAVHPGLARMTWEQNGPATPAPTPPPDAPKPAPVARGDTPAVHRHQREFFTMEGYRESLGTIG